MSMNSTPTARSATSGDLVLDAETESMIRRDLHRDDPVPRSSSGERFGACFPSCEVNPLLMSRAMFGYLVSTFASKDAFFAPPESVESISGLRLSRLD